MQQFKIICLWLVLSCLLPSIVMAGAVTDEEGETESSDAEGVEPKETSLRIRSDIAGFQTLNVAGVEIEATYLEETLGQRHGVIVFLHDQGAQLESQGVVTPLRHKMIEYGWSTFTMALDYPSEPNIVLAGELDAEQATDNVEGEEPVAQEADAAAEENKEPSDSETLPPISNQQRIDAAAAFLQAQDIKRIIFLGHGAGGSLAIEILSDITVPVSALILIGTAELSLPLETIFNPMKQPIFDIYGDNDLAGVAEAVKKRKTMMKRTASEQYSAREILGADHVFYGLEDTLVKTLRGWLNTMFVEPDKKK
ncbi:MAG: DUF3530 family protein [Proteobacteria bacterium]|nr:DUF3530 family protein [Pseudomonadota bacterium]